MMLVIKAARTWVPPPIQRKMGDNRTQLAEKMPLNQPMSLEFNT